MLKKFFFGKTTNYGKIFKILSERILRDTDQRAMFKFRKIWPTRNC